MHQNQDEIGVTFSKLGEQNTPSCGEMERLQDEEEVSGNESRNFNRLHLARAGLDVCKISC